MIVISGALVLVALVLLVIGLINPDLAFVYASIGVSLASFAFLIVGILQRRKEDVPDAELADAAGTSGSDIAADTVSEGVTTLPVVMRKPAAAAEGSSGKVLVVAGRPRYHVDGCRYLTGKEADEVEVADAREEGFTACGVCKPDDSLAAVADRTDAPVVMSKGQDAVPADEPEVEDEVEDEEEVPSRVPATSLAKPPSKTPAKAAARPAAKAAATSPAKAAVRTAAKAAPAKASVAAPAKTAAKPAAKAPAKAPAKTPAKAAPAKASPAKKAAAAPVKRGGVIVIPDRGKFHTPDCRYVRGADGALELTKAAATKQGYDACGVCNP